MRAFADCERNTEHPCSAEDGGAYLQREQFAQGHHHENFRQASCLKCVRTASMPEHSSEY